MGSKDNKIKMYLDKTYKFTENVERIKFGKPIKNYFYNKLNSDIFNLIIDANYKYKREQFIINSKKELRKKIGELCLRKKDFYLKLNKKDKILNPTGDISLNQKNFYHWHNYLVYNILEKEVKNIHIY